MQLLCPGTACRSSLLAFAALKGGSVGVSGSTGARREHNLTRMLDLLDRWVSENSAAAQLKQRP
jgi:hypothetical protein